MITQEELKKHLHYDPETGIFTRLICRYKSFIGKPTGYINKNKTSRTSYLFIEINNKKYKAHRLAFLYVYGSIPKEVDHIDGDGLNNKINNLRSCTRAQNRMNVDIQKNNTSNVKNVYWSKRDKKWYVQFKVNQISGHYANFVNFDDAVDYANKKREELHKEFANHSDNL